MNFAEVGHSKNARSGARNQSLAKVAEDHIVESAILKSKIENLRNGTYSGGEVPRQKQRDPANYSSQVRRASKFCAELASGSLNIAEHEAVVHLDPSSSHRANKIVADSSSDENSDNHHTATLSCAFRKRSLTSKKFQNELNKAKLLKNCTTKLVSSESDERYIFELKKSVNMFLVEISTAPGCNCGFVPDKEICEHVIYVMMHVLGVKENDQNLCQNVHSKTYIKILLSRYKSSYSKTIEPSIPETNNQTNVGLTIIDILAPSTLAQPQLNQSIPQVSNHTLQHSLSWSSTPARSLGHLERPSVRPIDTTPVGIPSDIDCFSTQGFAEAPRAQINRIPPAQNAIFTPRPTPRAPTLQVLTTQNAIFTPRSTPRAPTRQVPTTENDIFMPRPHALTHQITATQNAHLTPRPKPAEGSYEITLLQFCDPRVTTCHGCRQKIRFVNQPVPIPHDLVIVTKMRRIYYEDGQERIGKLGNVYFHCRADCIQKKQPLFLREYVTIAPNIQHLLTPAHQQTIRTLVAG